MFTRGLIFIVSSKPSKKVIAEITPFVLEKRCRTCKRQQVSKVPDKQAARAMFAGPFRFGECPNCAQKTREKQMRLDEVEAAKWRDRMFRIGKLIKRQVIAQIRRDAGASISN